MNYFNLIADGGWLMVPIIAMSIVSAAVIIERFLTLKKSTSNIRHLMMKVKGLIVKKDIEEAIEVCEATPGPTAQVLKEGMLRSDRNKEDIQEVIESAGKEQVYYLERYLGVLATIAGVAPLVGFLGTVMGMIEAFWQIKNLQGNVNAAVLSGGISEALITTAAGLIVGILTFFFYNYFVARVKRFVFEMETSSNELVELLVNGRS